MILTKNFINKALEIMYIQDIPKGRVQILTTFRSEKLCFSNTDFKPEFTIYFWK